MILGVIAEDKSDVAVVQQITTRLAKRSFKVKSFVGKGCGKIKKKAGAWATALVKKGCLYIVLVQDLDDNDENELRRDLTKALKPSGAKLTVVLISKRELEAWLLYDAKAIAKVFNEKTTINMPTLPEELPDPKAKLLELVWVRYKKNYITTIHNEKVAKEIDLGLLRSKSKSFAPHLPFVEKITKLR